MANPSVSSHLTKKISDTSSEVLPDLLAVEEPLEIRLGFGSKDDRVQKSISVTMRTPGNDFELAIGFLFTEGMIRQKDDIRSIRYCEKKERDLSEENIVLVELIESVKPDIKKLERNFYTASSCGICGKASIEAIHTAGSSHKNEGVNSYNYSRELIKALPHKLREQQIVFGHTGGLHAAALIDEQGKIILLREDIGRHNAVDKIIGAAFQMNLLKSEPYLLFLSGRSSFELLQKALMAGISCVASVGAPSSLAVSVAKEFNTTLIGFVRDNRFNVYNESIHKFS